MPNVVSNDSLNIGSIGTTSTKTFHVDMVIQNAPNETAPAYLTGTLSTRTSDTAGVATSSTHGLTTADTIAIVWGGGYRYDVEITVSDTDTITFSGGSGDNLPSEASVIYICNSLQIDFNVNATNLGALSAGGSNRTISSFLDDSDTSVFVSDMSANEKFRWYDGNGYANPLTGHLLTAVNIYNVATTTGTYALAAGLNNTEDQV